VLCCAVCRQQRWRLFRRNFALVNVWLQFVQCLGLIFIDSVPWPGLGLSRTGSALLLDFAFVAGAMRMAVFWLIVAMYIALAGMAALRLYRERAANAKAAADAAAAAAEKAKAMRRRGLGAQVAAAAAAASAAASNEDDDDDSDGPIVLRTEPPLSPVLFASHSLLLTARLLARWCV
jgi:hypothetical protein